MRRRGACLHSPCSRDARSHCARSRRAISARSHGAISRREISACNLGDISQAHAFLRRLDGPPHIATTGTDLANLALSANISANIGPETPLLDRLKHFDAVDPEHLIAFPPRLEPVRSAQQQHRSTTTRDNNTRQQHETTTTGAVQAAPLRPRAQSHHLPRPYRAGARHVESNLLPPRGIESARLLLLCRPLKLRFSSGALERCHVANTVIEIGHPEFHPHAPSLFGRCARRSGRDLAGGLAARSQACGGAANSSANSGAIRRRGHRCALPRSTPGYCTVGA